MDNLNIIFDNDTSILELEQLDGRQLKLSSGLSSTNKTSSSSSPSNDGPNEYNSSSDDKHNAKDAFVNSDQNDELERENYASCRMDLVKDIRYDSGESKSSGFYGRLNFWQPVNNSGVMHLVARINYNRDSISKQQVSHNITKRESFRTPIERPPAEGISADREALRLRNKHQIWVVDSCENYKQRSNLLAELIPTDPMSYNYQFANSNGNNNNNNNLVNIDAEIIVSQFNLTDTNQISSRYLTLELPDNLIIACCQVINTNNPATNEFDSWTSVSMVQPVREDILPDRLRGMAKVG